MIFSEVSFPRLPSHFRNAPATYGMLRPYSGQLWNAPASDTFVFFLPPKFAPAMLRPLAGASAPSCFPYGNEQTLGHVAGGCNSHLREGRFNWRHDSSDVQLYVDNDKFRSPSIITGDDQRLDLLLIDKRNNMYVLELTVGFEPNIEKNAKRKNEKYKELLKSMEKDYTSATFINLSIGLPRYNWERLLTYTNF